MRVLTAFGYLFSYLLAVLILTAPSSAAKQANPITTAEQASSVITAVKRTKLFSVTREAVAKRTADAAIGGAISEREIEFKKRSAVRSPLLANEVAQEAVAEARKKALEAGLKRCGEEFKICSEQKTQVVIGSESVINIDATQKDENGFEQKLGVGTTVVVQAKAKILIKGTDSKSKVESL